MSEAKPTLTPKGKAAIVFVILSAFVVYWIASRQSAEPAAAEKAPPLSAPTLSGATVTLASLSGKVVLVDFWATWCAPCKEEIPALNALRDRLAPRGFEILGVSMDEDGRKAVKKFLKKQPISYPVVINGGETPPDGWDVPGLPTAFLVGRDGTVLKSWLGEKDLDELTRDIETALASK